MLFKLLENMYFSLNSFGKAKVVIVSLADLYPKELERKIKD